MASISIITINKNNAKGLEKTIKSIIDQTNSNYELIVIDGASTDNSLKIINSYREKINQFVSEQDNGIYHAMNKGIRLAKNEYCFFLNSGDYFANNTVLEKIQKANIVEDIIYGNLIVLKKNKIEGKIIGKSHLSFIDLYLSNVIKHQSSFIKKELLIGNKLYDESLKIVADWEFFLKTIGYGKATYKYIDVDISFFDNDGISNNSEMITRTERELILTKYIPKLILEDYSNFQKYYKYKYAFNNRYSIFIIKILNKLIKVLRCDS
jgi:glycosyltransferase involved in cell wall biosynthesis